MCIDTDNVFLLSYLADKLKGECIAYFKQHVLTISNVLGYLEHSDCRSRDSEGDHHDHVHDSAASGGNP